MPWAKNSPNISKNAAKVKGVKCMALYGNIYEIVDKMAVRAKESVM